ncbi:MAG: CDP-alcohol phosphatidyltransferase family protein [Candidatus Cloacimonetes bacterium]|nr:CDP-alcohol phosphatidyltransferase family protein [Candidatus Cloacimonadota bacterium]
MEQLKKIKYIVPSALTALSVYFAYRAYLATSVEDGCWYLLLCVVMDKLDGSSARLLKATSQFGLKFDSFADAIAFGIIPGIILYESASLIPAPSHWVLAFKLSGFVYVIATFARLYKFDRLATQGLGEDSFFGIPSTLAAAIFATYGVAFGPYFDQLDKIYLLQGMPIMAVFLAILMNGTFPTLKVGVPEKTFNKILQTVSFIFCFIAIPTRQCGMILFCIAIVVLFITIFFGRKKHGKQKLELPENN